MKFRALLILCGGLFGGSLHATPMEYPWSFGLDLGYQHAKVRNDFARFIGQNKMAGNVYFAYKTPMVASFELGFKWTNNSPKTARIYSNQQVFGITATQDSVHQAKVRIQDTYFDVYANLPISRYLDFKLGMGIGLVRPKFKFSHSPDNADPLQSALTNLSGKSSVTGRFGFGLDGSLNKRFGTRLMFYYQTLSNVLISNTQPGVNRRAFDDPYNLLLGLYWRFNTD